MSLKRLLTRIGTAIKALMPADIAASHAEALAQLRKDIRSKDMTRLLDFEGSADQAHLTRVVDARFLPSATLSFFRRVLEQAQQVGRLGRDVEFTSEYASFTVLEVNKWDERCGPDGPEIDVIYRFAEHRLGPRTRVEFRISYVSSVDGTRNLLYLVRLIEEESAEDPHRS